MKYIILIISTIILLTDCTKQNSEVSVKLKKAAECIEQYPDSSLDILNTLQLNNITIQKERACYALLLLRMCSICLLIWKNGVQVLSVL